MKNRYTSLFLLFVVFSGISTFTRAVLLVKSVPQFGLSPVLFGKIFGMGLFFDIVTFFYLAIPFACYLALVPDRVFNHRWHKPVVYAFFLAVSAAFVFNGVAEYLFFDEFGTRYNFIAVDYLVYTREVLGNIKESYPLPLLFTGIFIVASAILFGVRRHLRQCFGGTTRFRERLAAMALFVVIPSCRSVSWTFPSPRSRRTPMRMNWPAMDYMIW